jgi:hypothetical protein
LKRALLAGLAYWSIVFTLGFVLGALRVLAIAPSVGSETIAVLIEWPFMLVASWIAARRLLERFGPLRLTERAMMGAFAFSLLLLAELALAKVGFGLSFGEWVLRLSSVPGAIGLVGQILFALFPLFADRSSPNGDLASGR